MGRPTFAVGDVTIGQLASSLALAGRHDPTSQLVELAERNSKLKLSWPGKMGKMSEFQERDSKGDTIRLGSSLQCATKRDPFARASNSIWEQQLLLSNQATTIIQIYYYTGSTNFRTGGTLSCLFQASLSTFKRARRLRGHIYATKSSLATRC